jgi:alpha-galactosidase
MKEQNINKPILKLLENQELIGITFIQDYIQFLFDDSGLNTYTLPHIKIQDKIVASTDFGYCDNLCSLINKKVISAYEDKKEEKIRLKFESDIEIFVSLRAEDRICAEAAMLQIEGGRKWNVW